MGKHKKVTSMSELVGRAGETEQPAENRRLDSIARLINGSDICTAICYDKGEILVSNNSGKETKLFTEYKIFLTKVAKSNISLEHIQQNFGENMEILLDMSIKGEKANLSEKIVEHTKLSDISLKLNQIEGSHKDNSTKNRKLGKLLEELGKKKEDYNGMEFEAKFELTKGLLAEKQSELEAEGSLAELQAELSQPAQVKDRVRRDIEKVVSSLATDSKEPFPKNIRNALIGGLKFIENPKKLHAEMAIIDNLYKSAGNKDKFLSAQHYIGISKLCCGHCGNAVEQVNIMAAEAVTIDLNDDSIIQTRGIHGNFYPNWIEPVFAKELGIKLLEPVKDKVGREREDASFSNSESELETFNVEDTLKKAGAKATKAANQATEAANQATEAANQVKVAATKATEAETQAIKAANQVKVAANQAKVAAPNKKKEANRTLRNAKTEFTAKAAAAETAIAEATKVIATKTEVVAEATEAIATKTEVVAKATEAIASKTEVITEATEAANQAKVAAVKAMKVITTKTKVVAKATEVVKELVAAAETEKKEADAAAKIAVEAGGAANTAASATRDKKETAPNLENAIAQAKTEKKVAVEAGGAASPALSQEVTSSSNTIADAAAKIAVKAGGVLGVISGAAIGGMLGGIGGAAVGGMLGGVSGAAIGTVAGNISSNFGSDLKHNQKKLDKLQSLENQPPQKESMKGQEQPTDIGVKPSNPSPKMQKAGRVLAEAIQQPEPGKPATIIPATETEKAKNTVRQGKTGATWVEKVQRGGGERDGHTGL